MTGIAEKAIRQAAEWWGTAKTSYLMHARGMEQHSHGVINVLGSINIVLASGRIGRPGCGYSTITGQGNGQGGREHGQKCDQLPGGRDIENPEHRRHIAGVWGVREEELPHAGRRLLRDVPQGRDGRDPRPALVVVQPVRVAAGQRLRQADAGEARVLRLRRLLPERDGPVRRRGPARLAARGGRGDRLLHRGPRDQDQQGRRSARRREAGLANPSGHREGTRPRTRVHVRQPAGDLRGTAAGVGGRRRRLLGHHLREDRGRVWRLLAVPRHGPRRQADRSPRHPAALRAGVVEPGGEGGRAVLLPGRQGSLQRSPPTSRRPRTWTPITRSS